MRFLLTTWVGLIFVAVGVSAGADEIWFPAHQFCGSATANVFDGGPPLSESGCIPSPDVPLESFAVSDFTQPGSMGAIATAATLSGVFTKGGELALVVSLTAAYTPSFFPGGDNPGGEAEAEVFSVIEFIMPADELHWDYELLIDEDLPFFEGSTLVTFENVTQSETVLTLAENTNIVHTTLFGNAGDLIRITSDIFGTGSMGPGSDKDYFSNLSMNFTPEPTTGVALLVAVLALRRRTHRE